MSWAAGNLSHPVNAVAITSGWGSAVEWQFIQYMGMSIILSIETVTVCGNTSLNTSLVYQLSHCRAQKFYFCRLICLEADCVRSTI